MANFPVATRVLSIQSHVVHGFVGNRCAVFPLERHGYDVDFINTVQFSNHTGYKSFAGQVLNDDDLKVVYGGLANNSINSYSYVLTGYVRDISFLNCLADIIKDLKSKNPDLFYICDPVLGDEGQYYVSPDLTQVFRDVIIPLTDIVTPNQFELEKLTGVDIKSEKDLFTAVDLLHQLGVKQVVVTSSSLSPDETRLYAYASSKTTTDSAKRFRYEVQRIKEQFYGAGDLFCGLLLSWLPKKKYDFNEAVKLALAGLQACLRRTYATACADVSQDNQQKVAKLELKIVQSQDDFVNVEVLNSEPSLVSVSKINF